MSIFQQDLKIHAEIEENVLMKKTIAILNSLEIKNVWSPHQERKGFTRK